MLKSKMKNAIRYGLITASNTFAWLNLLLYVSGKDRRVFRKGSRPYVAVEYDGVFSAKAERELTFSKLTQLLESAGTPFKVAEYVDGRLAIIVMSEHKMSVLGLLKSRRDLSDYYALTEKEQHNTNIPALISKGFRKNEYTLSVLVYRNVYHNNSRILSGEDMGVSLEFWSTEEKLTPKMKKRAVAEAGLFNEQPLKGALIAPVWNGVAKVLSPNDQEESKIIYAGKEYLSYKIFQKNLLDKHNFPIDLVYTWVDGSDSQWLERYISARKAIDPSFGNNSMSRYTDHDELKYSLRSVAMFAPWVRNIYVVTDRQTPQWLKTDKESAVKVIDHSEIFEDTSALPTFNSHAIESQLHKIKGLSNYYIYLNDDMFFARFTSQNNFFYPNGVARVQPSTATIGTGAPSEQEAAPGSAGKNARAIIEDTFNKYVTHKYRHTFYPQIKEIAQKIEEENRGKVFETMHSKFRSSSNIPFTSGLMQSYLLASKAGVPETYRAVTVNASSVDAAREFKKLLKRRDVVTFCINETQTQEGDESRVAEAINKFLESYFPFPSEWERNK